MMKKLLFSISFVCVALMLLFQFSRVRNERAAEALKNPTKPGASMQARIIEEYGRLPLSFEANNGQADETVRFLSRGNGYGLFLTPNEAVLSLKSHKTGSETIRMRLVGADADPQMDGVDKLPGHSNYFIGNDPKRWRADVPHYAKVQYCDVYPGVNMIYYGNQRQLEYDLIVSPGASPKMIALEFQGAEKIELGTDGDLILHTEGGEIVQRRPTVYQETDGDRQIIAGNYVIKNKTEIGFEVGAYDESRPLIIDPTLSYSTYLGGSDFDAVFSIAVDSSGNAYVTGLTNSMNFPTVSPFDSALSGPPDAFVTKLNPTGSALVYSTYLGGGGSDTGTGIAIDASGNAYINGSTDSTDFPTTPGAFQTANGGGPDVFVAKLNSLGNALIYSTYLGGSGADFVYGSSIVVDSIGNVFVTGGTNSADFPTMNPLQPANNGGGADLFVTKLNPSGSALVYSTYLGGSGFEALNNAKIAIDSGGNAYVTGDTLSGDFPTTPGAFQTASQGGNDAFVAKLNAAGNMLVYSTYLGGSGDDVPGAGIAVDSAGNAYVAGNTSSGDFPTANAFQASLNGSLDAFVTKLNPSGSALVYSTYLGGSGSENCVRIAIDSAGNAYVSGITDSLDFPLVNPVQAVYGGSGSDGFVTKLNAAGSTILFSTYLGGNGDEYAVLAVDSAGNIYATGGTSSNNFPVTQGAFQTVFGGGASDAFVAKITDVVQPTQVTIDIKPGSFPNSINPRSNGVIPVAILTTATFDATTVDPTSVKFGATGTEAVPIHAALEDVNKDGDLDLILQFKTQETGILCGATSASLTGKTMSGQPIKGSDSVNTVGCK